jgi:hypothetical protein
MFQISDFEFWALFYSSRRCNKIKTKKRKLTTLSAAARPFQVELCHMENHSPPITSKPRNQIRIPVTIPATAQFLEA